jgi:CRISPR-associated protein Csx10
MNQNTNSGFTPLGTSFRIRIEMKSDWHIGSGTGRPGDVDRLVRRDEDDLPYLPAKTLTGIWRDACERVALGLDNGTPDGWSRWIPFLFGEQPGQQKEELHSKPPEDYVEPRSAALSVRSARLPEELRKALKSKPAVREAVTFIKPGVSIDERSGRARPKFLRFEEMARIGATLEAKCEIDWSGCEQAEQTRAATALLVAGARLVERIGGKRRRGSGRCKLTVTDGPDLKDVLSWIAGQADLPDPPAPGPGHKNAPLKNSVGGEWIGYDLLITTETPLIVPSRVTGNLVETLDYIPGAHLLAIVSGTLRKIAAKAGVDLNEAIVNGDLMLTNATIDVDGSAGRPVPFCLYQEKSGDGLEGGGNVYNRFCEDTSARPQLKGYRNRYIGESSNLNLPRFSKVAREAEMHNVVNDEIQRPDESVGGVFTYQAIKTHTTLAAELSLRASLAEKLTSADESWLGRLTDNYRLGRSKKDDYGLVRLEISRTQQDGGSGLETDEPAGRNPDDGELTVWLLSDLLLRDERLRPSASIDRLKQELERELKVTLRLREKKTERLLSSVSRQNRTDSWQVGWGLPRPSLAGLAAGTCVVFTADGKCGKTRLEEIEKDGLGERRAEGYGRIRFNDPLLKSKLEGLSPAPEDKEPDSDDSKGEAALIPQSDYARLIEREAARREIERRALRFAEDYGQRAKALGIQMKGAESQPPLSQLGALRSVIARLQGEADRQHILNWVEHLEGTANRMEKWPDTAKQADGGGKPRLRKIRDLIERRDTVWELLEVKWEPLVITRTGQHELKSELWAEGVRALVDACVRKQKREVEKQRERENA